MSTRSVIGHIDHNNNFVAVYCHYDGYPSHMVPSLESLAEKHGSSGIRDMIIHAQVNGGMRAINATSFETFQETSNAYDWSYTIDDVRAGRGQEYTYIIDDTGSIVEFYDGSQRCTIRKMRMMAQGG